MNPPVMHLAKPVELPVKGKVLENAEMLIKNPKTSEPDEAAPVLKRAESLHREKE